MGVGIDLPPVAIIGLLVGVFLIVGLVVFGMGVVKLFTPVIDEGSINNFNGLVALIKSQIEKTEVCSSNFDSGGQPFYLLNGAILVGYNYDDEKQLTSCSKETATKPSNLIGKAGLCLHIEDNANNFDKDPQEPIQCYAFEENIVFLANKDDKTYGGFGGGGSRHLHPILGQMYEDLFLYGGECDIGEPNLGSTRLYVETVKEDNEIYVYISELDKESEKTIKERNDKIKKLCVEQVKL